MMDRMQFATYFDLQISKILSHHNWLDIFSSRTSCPLIVKHIFWGRHTHRYSWTLHFSFYANWGSDVIWTEIYGQDTQEDNSCILHCMCSMSTELNHYFVVVVLFLICSCQSRVSGVFHRWL